VLSEITSLSKEIYICIIIIAFLITGFHSKNQKTDVKVKVKLSLCLTKHHAMKAYWGNGSTTPLIL
jgi:hypothetical protein